MSELSRKVEEVRKEMGRHLTFDGKHYVGGDNVFLIFEAVQELYRLVSKLEKKKNE